MQREAAIRQELLACAVLVPVAVLLPVPALERLLLVLSMLLVVLAEFLNSAIETAIDRISLERHPLSGQAKDLGSAAVAVALLMSAPVLGRDRRAADGTLAVELAEVNGAWIAPVTSSAAP